MYRYVRWPLYIRLQRQKAVLLRRLRMPPALNQFRHTLDKPTATALFKILAKMKPEEKAERKARRIAMAKAVIEARKEKKALPVPEKPLVVKFGLNHVTRLVETNRAKLVAIAHDVDPVELVCWLPALCRKKKVPFCIVKGKSRLGKLVHMKTASCVAVTDVKKEDRTDFAALCDVVKQSYNENAALIKEWGKPVLGEKRRHIEAKKLKALKASEKK